MRMLDADDQRDRFGSDVFVAGEILVMDVVSLGSGILELEASGENGQSLWASGNLENAILYTRAGWPTAKAHRQGRKGKRIRGWRLRGVGGEGDRTTKGSNDLGYRAQLGRR